MADSSWNILYIVATSHFLCILLVSLLHYYYMYIVTNDMGLVYLLLVSLLVLLCCTYDTTVYVEIENVQCVVMKVLVMMF